MEVEKMALRNIVVEGDPILRKVCRPVDKVDDRIRMILDDMIDTMHDAMGVGLAAPQIGMMRRMFVAEPEEGEIYCFVNPEIITVEGEQECVEGCLSVPGYQGVVIRPEKIRIKGLDYNGKLTSDLHEAVVSALIMNWSTTHDHDTQLTRAREILNG
jgi:peptide deformylase